MVGMALGFHPEPGSTWSGTVSADGTKVRGDYLYPALQENGTWEMKGQARCMTRQAPPPLGSGLATIRWGDYVFRVALDPTAKYSIRTIEKLVTSVTGVPTIPNPYAVTLGIEAVYEGPKLPNRLPVFNVRNGQTEVPGYIDRVGTTADGRVIYRGSVTIPQSSLRPGDSVVNDIFILNPINQPQRDYVIRVLQTIIDPSGYVFDAATGQKLEGAMVSCYQRQGNSWVLWNADAWGQINPLVSDNVGHYGWDVPVGDYKVVVSRDCYQDGGSPVVTVPPPRTDVHIGLKKTGCSSLKLIDIGTMDNGGFMKSVFRSGEPIKYHVEVANSSAGDLSTTIHWTVTDPKGQRVAALSGYGIYNIASFGAEFSIDQKLPLNLESGDYRLRIHQTHQQQTSNKVTQFSIISGGRVAGMLGLLLGNKGESSCPAIPNGDFESGLVSWTEYSKQGWDLIDQWKPVTTHSAHSGTWYTWLGGDDNEIAYVQQQITVPSSCSYLAFYHWIESADVCGGDNGYVRINGTTVNSTQLCANNNTGGWVKKVVNLGAYTGQTVTLQIRAVTNGSIYSNWYIDDVSFQATASTAAGLELESVSLKVDPASQVKTKKDLIKRR